MNSVLKDIARTGRRTSDAMNDTMSDTASDTKSERTTNDAANGSNGSEKGCFLNSWVFYLDGNGGKGRVLGTAGFFDRTLGLSRKPSTFKNPYL